VLFEWEYDRRKCDSRKIRLAMTCKMNSPGERQEMDVPHMMRKDEGWIRPLGLHPLVL
jgi:hypothetical protein